MPIDRVVHDFDGSGTGDTPAFSVENGWSYTWTSEEKEAGRIIAVHDAKTGKRVWVNNNGKSYYTSEKKEGGSYFIRVTSFRKADSWHISVRQSNN